MEIPADVQRRLDEDHVVWLTTVTDSGAPSPNPVWFVPDGDDIVVFSAPDTHKVRNIAARPMVTLNFNSDPAGGEIAVITGRATATPSVLPSTNAAYVAKYSDAIRDELQTTMDDIDGTYDTELRIRPTRVRGTGTPD
jgi:PPOX class probable F420-dependent enzyme